MIFRFFALYHGTRKVVALYARQPPEMNVAIAGVVSILPMLASRTTRKMIPYGLVMIVLDAVNGLNDV